MKILCRKGHWSEFLTKVTDGEPISCTACLKLRDQYIHGKVDPEPEQEEQGVDVDPETDLLPRKRGRPRKGEVFDDKFLVKYIEAKRSGVYQITDTSESHFEYWCVPCNKSIPFFRNSLTYLKLHEQCQQHMKGLELLGIHPDSCAPEGRVPCKGVVVNELSGGVCGQLSELTTSLRAWFASGMPYVTSPSGKATMLEQSLWRMDGDSFICRHEKCSGAPSSPEGCQLCKALVQSPRLHSEIARWSYKIDLATLAHCCVYFREREAKSHRGNDEPGLQAARASSSGCGSHLEITTTSSGASCTQMLGICRKVPQECFL